MCVEVRKREREKEKETAGRDCEDVCERVSVCGCEACMCVRVCNRDNRERQKISPPLN